MIDYLDDMLRQLFLTSVSDITSPSQVSFEPPNDTFQGQVHTSGQLTLNVYLADLKENRIYRTNERTRSLANGIYNDAQAPRRVDCHYLISAWSPATATASVEPTLDEHLLLYQTMTALVMAEPFVPSAIFTPAILPPYWSLIANEQLPSVILPVEGFPKLAEFWGTTKTVHWKPAVYLVVTLPVVMPALVAGPMVTTTITEYEFTDNGLVAETLVQIGGSVVTGTPAQPITGAWVQLQNSAATPLTVTTTDANGHFSFASLRPGTYILRVRAQGFAQATRTVTVPSPTGVYDVPLS
jgi:hypothetical protein